MGMFSFFLIGQILLHPCVCSPPSSTFSPVNVSCIYTLYCYICTCVSTVAICTCAIVYVCWVHVVWLYHILSLYKYVYRYMLRLHISDWQSGLYMSFTYYVCGTCVYVFMHIKVHGHSAQHNVIHAILLPFSSHLNSTYHVSKFPVIWLNSPDKHI